ncbi:MAG: DUF6531 domain-containing protein [Roseburia sp. 1XD42-69]|jgi:RHS repeat-associated core domain
MGKDYLVNGAKLVCICGSKIGKLKIPKGHGYTSKKKEKANCRDCVAYKNISDFGKCSRNKGTQLCKGFMKLEDEWVSTGSSGNLLEKLAGKLAVTMDSVLLCKRGGLIMPVTSGQGFDKRINWEAFLRRLLKVQRWALGKNLMCNIFGEDPINLNTGNYIYEREDLKINGIMPLSFRLFYNAMDQGRDGCIGEGWHQNYEIHIEEEAEGKIICVCMGDGKVLPYRRSVGDSYVSVFGDKGVLKREGETYNYHTPGGVGYSFDGSGKLMVREDKNGNRDIFSYNGEGQLIQVKGSGGGEFFYIYNEEGKLICVRDHTGREVHLRYRYGQLYQFVNSCGFVYTYTYNENGKLESVITPRGIVGLRNTYDSADRVIKQEMPDGSVAELMYDDENNRTYEIQRNGNMVIYESDELFRNVKTIYEDGEEIYEYNDQNLVTLFVDKNGNKTSYSYDEKGNITGIRDALGRQRSFTYDGDGRLLTESMEGKRLRTNVYNEKGLLIKTEDALGRGREIRYNEKGQPEQVILPDDSSLYIAYDERGNIVSVKDPYGTSIKYELDDLNRIVATVDGEGKKILYDFDEGEHLLAVTNHAGDVRKFEYNESGKLVKLQDFDGSTVSIEYNAMGKPEKLIDKEGRERKWLYDLMGNVEQVVFPTGAVFCYRYDKNNRIVGMEKKKDLESREADTVYAYRYDAVGNLIYVSAGDGKEVCAETFYEYDVLNRLSSVTNPAGEKTCYGYDRITGKISNVTDPAGNQRTYRYNDAGELTEQTDIQGNVTHYDYNVLGKLCRITDGAGRVTKHIYQPGGRLEKTIYPNGREISYGYDGLGRISSKTYKSGYSEKYAYDEAGRVILVSGNGGRKKSYTYDAMGRVDSMTDALGNTTRYAYTLNGKLREVVDALGNRAEYRYDEMDKLIHICQHGKNRETDRVSEYIRDVFGQVVCIKDALGMEEFYRYDALGRVVEKTDRDENVTSYVYRPDGKIESILYGDGRQAEFSYTPLGQISTIKDWLGETKIERNPQGKPERITDHNGQSICYQWGKFGERTQMVYPDGTVLYYHYDNMLRLTELENDKAGRENLHVTYGYDKEGRISWKNNGAGYCTRWSYNDQGLPCELLHEDNRGIWDRYRYQYDARGNKTEIQKERRGLPEESGCYHYGYDSLGRLTEVEKDGDLLRSYAYDSFGNRIGKTDFRRNMQNVYAYDSLNRLTEEEIIFSGDRIKKNYEYDRRGNLVEEYQENELLHGYQFGATNRLEKAWNGAGAEAKYFYNGLGQRTGRMDGDTKEKYLLDLTKTYYNLLGVETSEKKQKYYWDYNVAAAEEEGNMLQYYLQDELGSPLRILYSTGKGETYGYDEFGEDLYQPGKEEKFGNRYSQQGEHQPFGYTGYRYDNVSGTYFAQAREFRPDLGRFTAEDVVRGRGGKPETLNRYGYCWGNPLQYVDLDGNNALTVLEEGLILAGEVAMADGPEPGPADIIALVIAGGTLIVAGVTAIKERDDEKERAVIVEGTKEDDETYIYRSGSGNATNLTPRQEDKDGLSYYLLVPTGRYTVTTIEAVNNTGVLIAEIDGPNHVSVRPINPTELPIWIATRSTAKENPYYLTRILAGISLRHNGGVCNVD